MNYWFDSNVTNLLIKTLRLQWTVIPTILIYFEKNNKRTNRHIFKVEFRQNDTYLLLETQTKKYFKTKDLSTNIFSKVACFLWLRFFIIFIYYTHLRFLCYYMLIIMHSFALILLIYGIEQLVANHITRCSHISKPIP